MKIYPLLIGAIVNAVLVSNSFAKQRMVSSEFIDALRDGKTSLEFRPRYENAKQSGLLDAQATTLRTRIGYRTADFCHAAIKVEMVDVANFFGQKYNPGVSSLSKPQYSFIQDPSGAGVTEAKFIYYGLTQNVVTLGRQYINLDNQRFVGMNNLRQYPQSFDALTIENNMIPSLDIFYSYVMQVNTNVANGRGGEGTRDLRTSLINTKWSGYTYGEISAYVYINNDRTTNINSNVTFGVRLVNPSEYADNDNFGYSLEVARQQARFNNPSTYVAYYSHLTLSKTIDCFTALIGVETFGGHANGANRAFITPLGSVDDFSGYAEVFTTTPNRGLQDYYASLSATAGEITIGAIYHYFRLASGPGSWAAGNEIDVIGEVRFTDQLKLNLVYANYNAMNSVAPSTQRFWAMLTLDVFGE